MNQQYYHKCGAMDRAKAETPLAIKETMHCRLSMEIAEAIVSRKLSKEVEIVAVNQYYTTDLLYQVVYKVKGEDKVQDMTVSEMEILELKRC